MSALDRSLHKPFLLSRNTCLELDPALEYSLTLIKRIPFAINCHNENPKAKPVEFYAIPDYILLSQINPDHYEINDSIVA